NEESDSRWILHFPRRIGGGDRLSRQFDVSAVPGLYGEVMTRPRYLLCAVLTGVAVAWIGFGGGRPPDILFERQMIDPGASETAAVADINGDGKLDIVSGENWYEAPKWTKHKFRDLDFTNNYVDNFSDLPLDVNGDGRIDIVSFSYFGKRVYWNENPGKG